MRKQTITGSEAVSGSGDMWWDLERLARVEFTSESAEHLIESALIPDRGPRAHPRRRLSRSRRRADGKKRGGQKRAQQQVLRATFPGIRESVKDLLGKQMDALARQLPLLAT